MVQSDKNTYWLRLDNAAKIYPAVASKELSSVFRVSAFLSVPVKIAPFIQACEELKDRFPYFRVWLRKGFFWYYLEETHHWPKPEFDDMGICRQIPYKEWKGLLFRVLVKENEISVEFFHGITDGFGALEFLKSLLWLYFYKCGYALPATGIKLSGEKPATGEFHDAYRRYFKNNLPPPAVPGHAYHLRLPQQTNNSLSFTTILIPVASIRKVSVAHQTTITSVLAAAYFFTLQSLWLEDKEPKNPIVRLQIPVNLRNIFPSDTMRNFALYVLPEIDMRLGEYTFEELVTLVHNYMQLETQKKQISRIIFRNVKTEKNIFVRLLPRPLKDKVISYRVRKNGISLYSGILTNLGLVTLPDGFEKHVKLLSMTAPPPDKSVQVNCGVVGLRDNLVLTFGNNTLSKEVERRFCTLLVKQKIAVKIINA